MENAIITIGTLALHLMFQAFCLGVLAWYRVNKKFKADRKTRLPLFRAARDFGERNWVELVATVLAVPQWPTVFREAFKLFSETT